MLTNWDWLATRTLSKLSSVAETLLPAGLALALLCATAWLLRPALDDEKLQSMARPTGTATATRAGATRLPTPTSFVPTATPEPLVHVVVEGEVLGLIAEEYGTTVEMLLQANGLEDAHLISVGQELIIVGAQRTPVLAATPSPTPTATPAFAMAPPQLLGPTDQRVFSGEQSIPVLQWISMGLLDQAEWYEVRVWVDSQGSVQRVWTKGSSWAVPRTLYPGPAGAMFYWDVAVVRRGGGDVGLVSPRSHTRRFGWH